MHGCMDAYLYSIWYDSTRTEIILLLVGNYPAYVRRTRVELYQIYKYYYEISGRRDASYNYTRGYR